MSTPKLDWRRRVAGATAPAWALFALAVGVRLAYLAATIPVPPQDTPDYDEIARNLLAGKGFVSYQTWFGHAMRSWRAPFYPFFLAAVYRLWGPGHLAVQGVQAVVGSVSAVLVYRLARVIRPAAAVTAGLLAAVYGPMAASCTEVMTETWFTFWTLLTLVILTPALTSGAPPGKHRSSSLARLVAGGITLGLSALTRPVGLLMWPAACLCAWGGGGRRGVVRALLIGIAAAGVVAPWTIRNYQVHGALVPITTQGGFIVARSNADHPAWRQRDGWGIRPEVFDAVPSETARDHRWLRQGLSWIGRHPGAFLRLTGERFLRFWYFLRPEYNFWFMLVLPLALMGWWLLRSSPAFCLSRLYVYVSLLVFCTLLYGSTRFRLPLEPLFLIAAAETLHAARRRLGDLRLFGLLGLMAAFHGFLWWHGDAVRRIVLAVLRLGDLR